MKAIKVRGRYWEVFLLAVLTGLTTLQVVYFFLVYEMSSQFDFLWKNF